MAGNGAGSRLLDVAARAGSDLVGVLAREYRADQTAAIDEVLLGVDREFENWKREYREKNRGALAGNAAADFAGRYEELAKEALEKYGHGDEVFHDALRGRLASHGFVALRDGGAYQGREVESWRKSQLEGQMAAFAGMIGENPLDYDAIDFEKRQLLDAWRLKNPGLDPGRFASELEHMTARSRMEALLANPDTAGYAGQLLGVDQGRMEYRADPAGRSGPKPGSKSEKALARNNFGFVKDAAGGFASYGSRIEGLAAIGERFVRYGEHPEKNWTAGTIREALNIYAPKSDGNDVEAYVAHVEQLTGIDGNARVSFRHAPTLAAIIAAVPRHEHGNFVRIEPSEALAAAELAIARQSGGGGLRPEELAHFRGLAQKRIQAAREAETLEQVSDLLARTEDLGAAERTARLYEHVAAMGDGAAARMALQEGLRQIRFDTDRKNAQDLAAAEQLLAGMESMNPLQASIYLRKSAASPGAVAIARKKFFAAELKESPENRGWTDEARKLIDQGRLQSMEEREMFALEHSLTTAQTRDIREYGGKLGQLSRRSIVNALAATGYHGKVPPDLYEMVKRALPDGREPGKAELEDCLRNLFTEGKIARDDARLIDAMRADSVDSWLPVVKYDEEALLNQELSALGKAQTPKNRILLKKIRTGAASDGAWDVAMPLPGRRGQVAPPRDSKLDRYRNLTRAAIAKGDSMEGYHERAEDQSEQYRW